MHGLKIGPYSGHRRERITQTKKQGKTILQFLLVYGKMASKTVFYWVAAVVPGWQDDVLTVRLTLMR